MSPNYRKRDFAAPKPDLDGKSLLVTGGTGSFGRYFIRTVLSRYKLERLIVFSRDELKQYEMQHEKGIGEHDTLRFFLGDVRDIHRLEMALRDVDIVIHAAALKHITAAEYNPFECIRTNVHGAENVVRAAIGAGVSKVVALSTDKAANPVNLYGASKLAADKIFIAGNSLAGSNPTRFSVVRYGNVLGSRGSVLPHFQRLIAEGAKSLPITDPRMTRFWITLQQGVDLVLSTLSLMQGGEIFVPKIPSMRVTDLGNALLPGFSPQVVGIRPGEKLHECLITQDEARNTYDLGDRYIIAPSFRFWTGEAIPKNAKTIGDETFSYTSDSNTEWLSVEDIASVVNEKQL